MAKGPGVPITFHFIALIDQLTHYKAYAWSLQPFFSQKETMGCAPMYYTNLLQVMQGIIRLFYGFSKIHLEMIRIFEMLD